jgi:Sulfotransferase family
VTTAPDPPSAAMSRETEEFDLLRRARLAHLIPVGEPLVLVSQVPRSGGTLLSQLFDGHPECHAHPHELQIGYPKKWDWPPLDLGAPADWFDILDEGVPRKHLRRGYRKSPSADGASVFPFLFSSVLQREIFEQCTAARTIESDRAVLDCYFTSYFNAWLDNHNLYTGPKKVVTAFRSRLVTVETALTEYFAAYPEGTLISIVRDPRGWYASALSHKPKYRRGVDLALEHWRRSTESALGARDRFGDRVLVVTYEQLVRNTEETMARVAERIGIAMSPILLEPTFNGRPTRSNSIEVASRQYGVSTERATAFRQSLDPETIAEIERLAGDLYERATAG